MEIFQTAEELFRFFRRKSSDKQKAIDLLRQYKVLGNQVEVLVDINHNHKSLLQRACILGWINVWTSLIEEYKCDPRFHVDDNGDTVLHTACLYGHVDLVRRLVSKPWSMDPLMKNINGVTPLEYSNKYSHVRKYLNSILDDIPEDMGKPESSASTSQLSKEHLFKCFRRKTSNQREAVELIHGYKSETGPLKDLFDSKIDNYKSLLQWAGIRGWSDVCKILIDDHHCCPNYEDDNKWTVLHNVCRNGYIDLVRYFVSKPFEMDPLKTNKKGFTPLEYSRRYGYTEITKYLESIIVPLNRSLLTKRNHSTISEDDSAYTGTTAKKPHGDGKEDDDNMETKTNNKTSETARKQRKRKNEISVDNSAVKKPFNDNGDDRTEDNVSKSSGSPKNIHKIPVLRSKALVVLKGKSAQWNDIGQELDHVSSMDTYDYREELRKDQSRSNNGRLEAVLYKWLEHGGDSSTWGQLIEVLKGLGFNDVVMRINTDVA